MAGGKEIKKSFDNYSLLNSVDVSNKLHKAANDKRYVGKIYQL